MRSDQSRELVGDHLDRVGRRSRFDQLEQRAKIGSRTILIAHGRNHKVSTRALPAATGPSRSPRHQVPYGWDVAAVRRRAASWLGGAPNWRRYSRLNCEGLS